MKALWTPWSYVATTCRSLIICSTRELYLTTFPLVFYFLKIFWQDKFLKNFIWDLYYTGKIISFYTTIRLVRFFIGKTMDTPPLEKKTRPKNPILHPTLYLWVKVKISVPSRSWRWKKSKPHYWQSYMSGKLHLL